MWSDLSRRFLVTRLLWTYLTLSPPSPSIGGSLLSPTIKARCLKFEGFRHARRIFYGLLLLTIHGFEIINKIEISLLILQYIQ
jgi:hypothetical protein